MPQTVQTAVIRFFEGKGGLPGRSEEEKMSCPFLDLRLVDSIGIVEMVACLEKEFGIRFEPAHFQSEDFKTPAGVVRLVERLAGRQESK